MNHNEFVIETVTAAVRSYIEKTGEPPKRLELAPGVLLQLSFSDDFKGTVNTGWRFLGTPLETHLWRVSGEVDLIDQRYERHPVLLAGFILPKEE
jgi:hypothetical protein